jgi:hypothetical protein
MKININELKEIDKHLGQFEIRQSTSKNPETYLRFGYWRKINLKVLSKILELYANVYEESIYDDDTGWKYWYVLKFK